MYFLTNLQKKSKFGRNSWQKFKFLSKNINPNRVGLLDVAWEHLLDHPKTLWKTCLLSTKLTYHSQNPIFWGWDRSQSLIGTSHFHMEMGVKKRHFFKKCFLGSLISNCKEDDLSSFSILKSLQFTTSWSIFFEKWPFLDPRLFWLTSRIFDDTFLGWTNKPPYCLTQWAGPWSALFPHMIPMVDDWY